jgi:hypothetical protein
MTQLTLLDNSKHNRNEIFSFLKENPEKLADFRAAINRYNTFSRYVSKKKKLSLKAFCKSPKYLAGLLSEKEYIAKYSPWAYLKQETSPDEEYARFLAHEPNFQALKYGDFELFSTYQADGGTLRIDQLAEAGHFILTCLGETWVTCDPDPNHQAAI